MPLYFSFRRRSGTFADDDGETIMGKPYDAIVVGARCAGSSTAMLLARRGYRVLVVDRATFPSDTISTHIVWQHGVSRLIDWGLGESLQALGAPALHTMKLDFGPVTLTG